MTKYQVKIGSQAHADITGIVRYIRETLLEPRTAANLYRRLKTEIASLDYMPERYPFDENAKLHEIGIRKLVIKNYKALYFVDHEQRLVQVARVVYAGRDLSKLLEETEFEES